MSSKKCCYCGLQEQENWAMDWDKLPIVRDKTIVCPCCKKEYVEQN
nr:hypothetical protein [Brevibacillus laterosporus]